MAKKNPDNSPHIIEIKELAKRLKVSVKEVREKIASGKIPAPHYGPDKWDRSVLRLDCQLRALVLRDDPPEKLILEVFREFLRWCDLPRAKEGLANPKSSGLRLAAAAVQKLRSLCAMAQPNDSKRMDIMSFAEVAELLEVDVDTLRDHWES